VKLIGTLEPFFETGTEGIVWSLAEDEKQGYEGLHYIQEGDHLTVFGENNEIVFDGNIVCDWEIGWMEYPLNPGHGQPSALGYWIHWIQAGWEPDNWARLFFHQYLEGNKGKSPLRAELIKKER